MPKVKKRNKKNENGKDETNYLYSNIVIVNTLY